MNIPELAKYLSDEEAATDLMESLRWPDGRNCPYCGSVKSYQLKVAGVKRRRYKCADCRKQFTLSVGTVMEGSHIPFGQWIYVIYQMCVARKGVSANQISKELGITYKSAWFLCHRVRYAMSQEPLKGKLSGTVEIDETYVGGKRKGLFREGGDVGRSPKTKTPVVSLIQRDGEARSFVVPSVQGHVLKALAYDNVEMTSQIMTDKFVSYKGLQGDYVHQSVDHSKEYVRGIVHVNFAESYFSLLKRGIVGTFHHISKDHMQRYLDEFDYRWNTRKSPSHKVMAGVVKGSAGKRLTYKKPIETKTN